MMGLQKLFLYLTNVVLLSIWIANGQEASPWRWSCEDGKCVKTRIDPANKDPVLCLEACKMFCNENGLLWPKPTGKVDVGSFLSKINIKNIDIKSVKQGRSSGLMEEAGIRFKGLISTAVPEGFTPKATGKSLQVYLINNNPDIRDFSLDMDESYSLHVSPASSDTITANISAGSFWGVRHGLETLSQLILYDDIRNNMLIARDVTIEDKPVYPFRGVHMDTARNFYSIDSIKATINTMAAVKMNSFHWHITDTHSFPFESTRRPYLYQLGAYSPTKVYTKAQIADVVEYARVRGVRVIPEFDAPAHVGEGWQDTDLTVCFKAEPWASWCVEPPCGQLNPTKEEVYDHLEDIYQDMAEAFNPDIFHMGGDEVSLKCWNASEQIQNFMIQNRWDLDKASLLKLWNYFQQKAADKAYKAFGKKLPLILWTSTFTDFSHIDQFLNKEDYIIHIWTTGTDPQIKGLLEKGYKLILSNYDALYLDCGYGAWVGEGNNWCSPYIGWQKVYMNSPAQMTTVNKELILGGETALWSEQADSATLEARLWPRAAAWAERLWAEPGHWREAEQRILNLRERLVRMGVKAESLEPEWCYQNEGYCY